jgi:proline iminopeptidase
LQVDEIHNLYWEISGNPDGVPVIVLHGGPGAGAAPVHRRFFDPNYYKIVIFDQRGAGRSTPHGELKNNTRANLVEDIEALRTYLRLESFHVFGGSWGATLALSYAVKYPQNILSLTLRSIFLLEQSEIDWFMSGIRNVFPEIWEHFAETFPEASPADLLETYYKALTTGTREQQMKAALAWAAYESSCMSFYPRRDLLTHEDEKEGAWAMARIEAHYFAHEVIAETDSLLKNVSVLKKIPGTIIQGRYDMICPVISADKLHRAWPEADYVIVPDGGHSAIDPSVCARLIETMEFLKQLG